MADQTEPKKSPEQERFEALARKVLQAKPVPKAKDDSQREPSQPS